MTKVVAPSLDQVLESKNPAWLWDSERLSIVWANAAGVDWFGAETLFDLLDLVFDVNEASVNKIKSVANSLQRGQSAHLTMDFSGGADKPPVDCECFVHALADGRSGLLIVADQNKQDLDGLSPAIQNLALTAFPLPILVVAGTNKLLFANQSAVKTIGRDVELGFAENFIVRAHKAGLVSGQVNINTEYGKRDMRIIIRPLELEQRLADTSFLLVLEDITARRALQNQLLDAAADKARQLDAPEKDTTQAYVEDQSDERPAGKPLKQGDVAQTLSHLRSEIESQARNDQVSETKKTSTNTSPKSPSDGSDGSQVPQIVSDTLNNLPQPLVLIGQKGQLLFANNVAVKLMAVKSWPEIEKITSLIDALNVLEGEDGEVSVFTAADEPVNLDAIVSVFPWKDGPVWQYTLSIADDGESADNRRKPNDGSVQKKKMKKRG